MRPYRGTPIDKPINSGEFVYGWYAYLKLSDKHIITESSGLLVDYQTEVHPATVGQQTPEKDKNKKVIYEGDRIKVTCKLYNPAGCQPDPPEYRSWEDVVEYPFIKQEGYVYEIIGTIHEEAKQ